VTSLRAARFLVALGLRIDRGRLIRAVALMLAGYAAAPFAALAFGRFADAALAHRFGVMPPLAVLIAVLMLAQLMLSHFAHLDYFELAEMQESALRIELIDLVQGPPGIAHLDDARFADNASLVRESLFANTQALEAVLQLAGLTVQTVLTVAILISLSPLLALLPLFAVPPVWAARSAQDALEQARDRTAADLRLSEHLLQLSTSAASVKELRVFGAESALLRRQELAWQLISRHIWRGQALGAVRRSAGQLVFCLGYGGALFLIVGQAVTGHATIGDLILVITLAVQVSVQISAALQLLTLLQSAGRSAARIELMRTLAHGGDAGGSSAREGHRPRPVPGRLAHGITLDRVSFAYPGSPHILIDVSLHIPAGSTLAIVGDNGAGKSTFMKLLCGMYAPSAGRITIDGTDVGAFDPVQWRARIAALFQDFYKFEFTLREGIGLGEASRLSDDDAIATAVRQARAEPVVEMVPGGLSGYIGRGYEDGIGLSGGQWQTIGLARSLMRARPLLTMLDEPAAALDAAAEHDLFRRYAASASAAREVGGVTVLISHRFSTVLMADLIAVLDHGRIAESGSHEQLMARDGLYAELFRLQASAYR
jgi:ATP-binding cassette, subfamily B, bacterial